MKPLLRAFPLFLTVSVCVPVILMAQSRTPRPDDKSPRAADGAGGTMVKKAPVVTEDDIAKLTVRKFSAYPESQTTKQEVVTVATSPLTADPELARAEIASLRQQVKEKQRKVELLMHMFVTDEQRFLRDPSGQNGADEAQMKRRFEQEELHKETAELAKLRARLETLTGPVMGQPTGTIR